MGIIEAIKTITMEEGIEKGIVQGIERGERSKTYEIVKNMLLNTDCDISKIAALTNSPESFIEKVRKDIRKK